MIWCVYKLCIFIFFIQIHVFSSLLYSCVYTAYPTALVAVLNKRIIIIPASAFSESPFDGPVCSSITHLPVYKKIKMHNL